MTLALGGFLRPAHTVWAQAPVSSGSVITVAGNGTIGFAGDGGLAIDAAFNGPYATTVGPDGTLYIGSGDVPEPTTICLLFILGWLSLGRQRMRMRASALVAALASVSGPLIYAAPTLQIVPGGTFANGRLNADGNWVWKVQIATSNPIPSGSSPLEAELGFRATGSVLLDANNLSTGPGDDFDTVLPGTPIWGWENPGTGTNGFPEGLQSNCTGGLCTENTPGDDPNTIFASFGSQIYGSPTTADFIEIITKGPNTSNSLTSSISVSGVYGVGNNKGRIAEWNNAPPPDKINHDIYTGTFSFTAMLGDANLDGSVNDADYQIWLANIDAPDRKWHHANFDNHLNKVVDGADYDIWLYGTPLPGDFNFDGIVGAADYVLWRKGPTAIMQSGYNVWRKNFGEVLGSGTGNSAAVPEPSALHFALTILASISLRSGHRRCGSHTPGGN
jgi:hypothetical protein